MFGTRVVAEKAQELFAESTRSISTANNSVPGQFIQRLCQQGKLVSQIIAYIWLWADQKDNKYSQEIATALSLRHYFISPNNPEGNLMSLLTADPNSSGSKEAELLVNVFGQERAMRDLPIFDKVEAMIFLPVINVNAFQGSIEDPDINTPKLMKVSLPFPPRPQFGKATVTEQELEDWIKNEDLAQFIADNPYIPATCCS